MSGVSAGCQMTGRIVRVMMFQSSLTEIGITGWMFRMFCVSFCGPNVEVGVVLERHADQVADRVLRELGQLLGAHLRADGTCREERGSNGEDDRADFADAGLHRRT